MTITATKIGVCDLGVEVVDKYRIVVISNGVRWDGKAVPCHGDSLDCWLDWQLCAAVSSGACSAYEIAELVGVL